MRPALLSVLCAKSRYLASSLCSVALTQQMAASSTVHRACQHGVPSNCCQHLPALQEAKLKEKKSQAWKDRLNKQATEQQAKQQKWVSWPCRRGPCAAQRAAMLQRGKGRQASSSARGGARAL